MKGIWPKLLS